MEQQTSSAHHVSDLFKIGLTQMSHQLYRQAAMVKCCFTWDSEIIYKETEIAI